LDGSRVTCTVPTAASASSAAFTSRALAPACRRAVVSPPRVSWKVPEASAAATTCTVCTSYRKSREAMS